MSELDELEEFNLEATHTGSAKRIRKGKKHFKEIINNLPKWRMQLRGYKAGQNSGKRR